MNYSIKSRWEKFDRGDLLSDEDLDVLIDNVEQGIEFLEARGETGGVLFKALVNSERLHSYRFARKCNGRVVT